MNDGRSMYIKSYTHTASSVVYLSVKDLRLLYRAALVIIRFFAHVSDGGHVEMLTRDCTIDEPAIYVYRQNVHHGHG